MEFLDGFKPVNPTEYLSDRVKRGAEFVKTIWNLNKTVDLRTSEHYRGEQDLDEAILAQHLLGAEPTDGEALTI